MINLGTVNLNQEAKDNVMKCLDTSFIGQGKFIEKFEDKTAEFIGKKHAIAVCNGSMADIIALSVLKTMYPDKTEVIVPALTFIAQVNAIIINGLKPVFVDVKDDYQIDVSQIKITDKTLAIMPVHLLGKRCDIEKMPSNITILEDCCEGFGIKPLNIGTCSFFPSHTITTGEGGMILTDDDETADLCRKVRNHGRRSDNILDKFHFDIFGFNGKMSNIAGAIGVGVIEEAQDTIKTRQYNVAYLNKKLGQNWDAVSPHCYPVMCKNKDDRNIMIKKLYGNGVEARKIFSSLPTQEKVYQYMDYEKGCFPVAEDIGDRGLYVPCHQNLSTNDLDKICQVLKK